MAAAGVSIDTLRDESIYTVLYAICGVSCAVSFWRACVRATKSAGRARSAH